MNVGIHKRGTAILTREKISLTNITRLPSGRGMAACYRGVWLVNPYTPSCTAKIQKREDFYNVELVYLLRSLPPTIIVGRNFNCVLSQVDCIGNMNYSKALDKLVRGFELTDVWERSPQGYTHTLHPKWSGPTRPYVCLSEPWRPQDWSGNSAGSIHRSPGGMLAYNSRCTIATNRKGTVEKECKASGGDNL